MSREDFEIFKELEEKRRKRRAKRLANTSEFGWSKHTETHWYRFIDGEKLHYWPSANKWLYMGRYYRGGLPGGLKEKIDEDNRKQLEASASS